jgi:hypothetical protein
MLGFNRKLNTKKLLIIPTILRSILRLKQGRGGRRGRLKEKENSSMSLSIEL